MPQFTTMGSPRATVYGTSPGGARPFSVDSEGRVILSPSLSATITATNLDIRALSSATDSVTATATNLDIRDLSGAQDSILRYGANTALDSDSGTILALGTRIFLTKNVGAFRRNVYLVQNTGGVLLTVQLEIAPVDTNSYYVVDGTSFSLIGGGNLIFTPSVLSQYARIRVSAVLLGSATVYYFAQT